MEFKNLNVTITKEEWEQLDRIKGDRDWREAILDEFGVDES
jgi:hypothetical protein